MGVVAGRDHHIDTGLAYANPAFSIEPTDPDSVAYTRDDKMCIRDRCGTAMPIDAPMRGHDLKLGARAVAHQPTRMPPMRCV